MMEILIEEEGLDGKFMWKYLNLHKLLYFLQEGKLHFTRSDLLDDPNEGLPEKIIKRIYEYENFPGVTGMNPASDDQDEEGQRQADHHRDLLAKITADADRIQKKQFINSWFTGERESYAMWNIYSNPESVALKFKPGELIRSIKTGIDKLRDEQSDFEYFIGGMVNYQKVYPPGNDKKKNSNKFSALKKDISFESEKEYRFVAVSRKVPEPDYGFRLHIENLQKLDFQVITHPKMAEWMYDNILSFLKSYKLEKKLLRSDIKLRIRHS